MMTRILIYQEKASSDRTNKFLNKEERDLVHQQRIYYSNEEEGRGEKKLICASVKGLNNKELN